ncbi:major facilitator superfamily domain-containing protein [Boletus coccyginus]|nr:major facilitator superfamily domain-containing protein [Boletus coccyginus]
MASSSFAMGTRSMMHDLHCTEFQAMVALCIYPLGFALRRPIYLITAFASCPQSDHTNSLHCRSDTIQWVIIGHALSGAFASTGATLVGGTIADIWEPVARGLLMSLFTLVNMTCTGFRLMVSGWIKYDSHLQWRWIQWLHAMFVFSILETQPTLGELMWISCTWPILVLLTEPIVTSIGLWVFFMWGVLFCLISSVLPLFRTLYGFNDGQCGLVYTTIVVGAFMGFGANLYQDKLYRQNVARKGPEARLYLTCLVAVLFPLVMFMFAWTALQEIHWIWPIIALMIFMFGAFITYLIVFLYLADCFAFPLFADYMFADLTYKWSNTLFTGIALLIFPVPFVLFFYGSSLC